MKLIKQILFFITLLIIVLGIKKKVKKNLQQVTDTVLGVITLAVHPDSARWNEIFNTQQVNGDIDCTDTLTIYDIDNTYNVTDLMVPRMKENIYNLKQGFGSSSFLFDYIDQLLQDPISKALEDQFNNAKALTLDPLYLDLYNLSIFLPGQTGTDDELAPKYLSLNPKFNYDVYKNSLTTRHIKAVIDQWNYGNSFIAKVDDYATKYLSKFDFDGDGRLNPLEFSYFSVVFNKYGFTSLTAPCTNCFNDVIKNFLDPIYTFIDCMGINAIDAEAMWNYLKLMKRPRKDDYNMYKCEVKEGNFRTSSCNDLILKVQKKKVDAKVTKEEFREAILLGYVNRQVTNRAINKKDESNMKSLRWSSEGKKDLVCDRTNFHRQR